jgi:hypothetical protein
MSPQHAAMQAQIFGGASAARAAADAMRIHVALAIYTAGAARVLLDGSGDSSIDPSVLRAMASLSFYAADVFLQRSGQDKAALAREIEAAAAAATRHQAE